MSSLVKAYKRLVALVFMRFYSQEFCILPGKSEDETNEIRRAIISTASFLLSKKNSGFSCSRKELVLALCGDGDGDKRGKKLVRSSKLLVRHALKDRLIAHGFVESSLVNTSTSELKMELCMTPKKFTEAVRLQIHQMLKNLDIARSDLEEDALMDQTGGATFKCRFCSKVPQLTTFDAIQTHFKCAVCGSDLQKTWSIESARDDMEKNTKKKIALNRMFDQDIKPALVQVESLLEKGTIPQKTNRSKRRKQDHPGEVVVVQETVRETKHVQEISDPRALEESLPRQESSSSSSSQAAAALSLLFRVGDRLVPGEEIDEEEDPDEMSESEYERYFQWATQNRA